MVVAILTCIVHGSRLWIWRAAQALSGGKGKGRCIESSLADPEGTRPLASCKGVMSCIDNGGRRGGQAIRLERLTCHILN